jgi:hypothetical protein
MRNFKNETMNVDFLLETFFIQFLNARSSLSATFLSWSCFDVSSITRDDDLKDFFRFKILFTIVTIFIFFWEIFAIKFNARVELWFLFWKQLFFDVSSIVFCVLMNCCLHSLKRRIDFDTTKKKFFFFVLFIFVLERSVVLDQCSLFEI